MRREDTRYTGIWDAGYAAGRNGTGNARQSFTLLMGLCGALLVLTGLALLTSRGDPGALFVGAMTALTGAIVVAGVSR